jgi:UMF1 family MFS transporter
MADTPGSAAAPAKDDPRSLFGWCMYDWANSAYVTTVAVGLLPRYFADAVVPAGGVPIGGTTLAADTLWGAVVGIATLIAFLTAPVLGAIADFSSSRKRFLLSFAFAGSLCAILLSTCRSGDVFQTLLLFLLAQVGFIGANVFYDAFLPHIASDANLDRVSGRGYAFGYVGGGLQFALSLLLVSFHDVLGLALDQAVRLSLVMAGLWWAGFTLVTARLLVEARSATPLPDEFRRWPRPLAFIAIGVSRTLKTTRKVRQYKHLALFLAAFMLYDDGIQTVINMATIYATVELGLPATVLMLTLLVIQAIAGVGAWLFSRLAGRIGTQRCVMMSLVLWTGIVIYAGFLRTAAQFVALGAVVGLVMGGSQALSRSFYGSMIPKEASAEFYGFYTVFSKFAAMWGPWAFAIVKHATGSSRLAILSLVVQFLAGLILLAFVDPGKAREARTLRAF